MTRVTSDSSRRSTVRGQKVTSGERKMRMNSSELIDLRLTLLSIGDQRELTRAAPSQPCCRAFRGRKMRKALEIFLSYLFPFSCDWHEGLQYRLNDVHDYTTTCLCTVFTGRQCNRDVSMEFSLREAIQWIPAYLFRTDILLHESFLSSLTALSSHRFWMLTRDRLGEGRG